ncbi:cytochrome P450 9e2-like [Zerene cesonia]|uniref:cytochrome P450 9e2-like n=1 Tax=Zerene cesonia TaxID=33412 RepID=UPI0018E569A8|nr:cytochrome P450 9e2-like [Zerene cesonia]
MESANFLQRFGMIILEYWKFTLPLTILIILYYHFTSTFNFFKKRGIDYLEPTVVIGNMGANIIGKQAFHDFQREIYNRFKKTGYGGVFLGRQPVLYITDPELIKAVTIRDFENFVDRYSLPSNEPLYFKRNLLNLKSGEWKGVRSIITPSFSSLRLKHMLHLIKNCSDQMVGLLNQFDNSEIEMKETMGRFTLEVIGACAFGIKSDSLTDENARFVKVAEKYDHLPWPKRIGLFFILMFIPEALRFINISFLHYETIDQLVKMLKKTKAERKLSNTKHNDFLQLLLDAAEKEREEVGNTLSPIHLDDDTIDAQSLLFFIAGYETSSTLLSCAIFLMAVKPEFQDKLRAHVEEMTKDKEVTYDVLSQLDYLEAFLLETLRMYPPIARIDRVCTKPYTLPGTSVKINVDEMIAVPLYGVHMDPDHYPEPEQFKPERFIRDGKLEKPSHLFLAFGAGPRNCIGLRFAMISAKHAMVTVLKNFKFSTCPKTEYPIRIEETAPFFKSKAGLWVKVERL